MTCSRNKKGLVKEGNFTEGKFREVGKDPILWVGTSKADISHVNFILPAVGYHWRSRGKARSDFHVKRARWLLGGEHAVRRRVRPQRQPAIQAIVAGLVGDGSVWELHRNV